MEESRAEGVMIAQEHVDAGRGHGKRCGGQVGQGRVKAGIEDGFCAEVTPELGLGCSVGVCQVKGILTVNDLYKTMLGEHGASDELSLIHDGSKTRCECTGPEL